MPRNNQRCHLAEEDDVLVRLVSLLENTFDQNHCRDALQRAGGDFDLAVRLVFDGQVAASSSSSSPVCPAPGPLPRSPVSNNAAAADSLSLFSSVPLACALMPRKRNSITEALPAASPCTAEATAGPPIKRRKFAAATEHSGLLDVILDRWFSFNPNFTNLMAGCPSWQDAIVTKDPPRLSLTGQKLDGNPFGSARTAPCRRALFQKKKENPVFMHLYICLIYFMYFYIF